MNSNNGIKVVPMDDFQLGNFYNNLKDNSLAQCHINQYLLIQARDNTYIGPYHWDGKEFTEVRHKEFGSRMFGKIKPKENDPFQIAYMDSLCRNQATFCFGKAGSGKSLIALSYVFQELEKGRVDRIYMFVNPVAAKESARLGFLPGSLQDKLLNCQVGNLLTTKLGSITAVEDLLYREQLILVPMSNSRGIDVPDGSLVYMSEGQNMSIYLMKLFLQRIPDGVKAIIEGDVRQVDDVAFENGLNGMARAVQVLQGKDYVGSIELQNCYRGRLAADVEDM